MRIPFALLGVLAISGCSADHAGPELPPGASSADQQPSSAQPPSVTALPSSIPSASPTFPSPRSSLPPSATVPAKPVMASSARTSSTTTHSASTSASSGLEAVSSSSGAPVATANTGDAPPPLSDNFDNLEMDPSLKGKLGITRVGSEPSSNDLLSVFAGLKNRTSHALPLEVQTLYKDRLGSDLNAGSWIPLTLKPHEETEYRSTSISPSAVDFLVRIRHASSGEQSPN